MAEFIKDCGFSACERYEKADVQEITVNFEKFSRPQHAHNKCHNCGSQVMIIRSNNTMSCAKCGAKQT